MRGWCPGGEVYHLWGERTTDLGKDEVGGGGQREAEWRARPDDPFPCFLAPHWGIWGESGSPVQDS